MFRFETGMKFNLLEKLTNWRALIDFESHISEIETDGR